MTITYCITLLNKIKKSLKNQKKTKSPVSSLARLNPFQPDTNTQCVNFPPKRLVVVVAAAVFQRSKYALILPKLQGTELLLKTWLEHVQGNHFLLVKCLKRQMLDRAKRNPYSNYSVPFQRSTKAMPDTWPANTKFAGPR